MTTRMLFTLMTFALMLASHDGIAADDTEHHAETEHHLPHNHIALFAAAAFEEQSDGHRQRGYVLGLSYLRQVSERWGWGGALEMEVFGDHHDRLGVVVVPISYFPGGSWRLFGGPGWEFREPGEREHAIFRLGAGYEFELGKGFTLSPEAAIDFVSGGTTVYELGFALGYGF